VLRVNAQYTPGTYDGSDRRPFQGSVDQIVEDLVAFAEVGLEEILIDFLDSVRDARELVDVAARVYDKTRAAGV
jgi:hypothetical protein